MDTAIAIGHIKNTGFGLFSNWCDASYNSGVKYSIGIHPNDPYHEGETWINFCLNKLNIDAVFNVTIESANYVLKKHLTFGTDNVKGEKLCTTEELFDPEKRFIVDGKMTINMEGILMIEKEAENEKLLECDENPDRNLCLALWKQENKDFTISADGKEIHAHKNVLAARSPDILEKYLISVINEITVCRLTNAALLSNASKLEMKCKEFLKSCLKTKPIADFDILDKDFALNLLKNSFSHVPECIHECNLYFL
uniref:BTB domain-containing protein n=1 Tax=Panagrolaimus sp. PS1159 TaxID=55785 RepID=A0AC35F4T4_9BILA